MSPEFLTFIFLICMGVAYWWGYGQGKTAGAFMATEAMMNWVKEKAGVFQFDQWMRESEEAEEDETLL